MQRLVDLLGQQAIGTDRQEDVGGLDAHLEVLKVEAIQVIHVAHGRLEQGFRGRLAILFLDITLQGAAVDADADRNVVMTGTVDHGAHPLFVADVARIDAQAVGTVLGHFQGDAVVEVDVGDDGNAGLLLDELEGFRRFHGGYRDPDYVSTDPLDPLDLLDGGGDIRGLGVGHGLHRDGGIAPNRHVADHDLPGLTTNNGGFVSGHGGQITPAAVRSEQSGRCCNGSCRRTCPGIRD